MRKLAFSGIAHSNRKTIPLMQLINVVSQIDWKHFDFEIFMVLSRTGYPLTLFFAIFHAPQTKNINTLRTRKFLDKK